MGENKKERQSNRVEFRVRIGPELMEVLEQQIKSIQEVTYGVVGKSLWEAGEIIAKKLKGNV